MINVPDVYGPMPVILQQGNNYARSAIEMIRQDEKKNK